MKKLKTYLKSLPVYNPETEPDYIEKLTGYISVSKDDEPRFKDEFKNFLVRSIASGLSYRVNKEVFIIVNNKQGIGKSTFLRWLCPPAIIELYSEKIEYTKESLIALTKKFIINLDECTPLSNSGINKIKRLVSIDMLFRKQKLKPRRCNFVASFNNEEILNNSNYSQRFLVFKILNINWNYKTEIDINKVWAQAYYLFNQLIK